MTTSLWQVAPDGSSPARRLTRSVAGESGGHAMRARIRAGWPGARLAARAVPVRCTPGDNLAIHVAVAEAPTGMAPLALRRRQIPLAVVMVGLTTLTLWSLGQAIVVAPTP